MNDRELLERAAKADGHDFFDGESWEEWAGWNPLEDETDALRLAVKLNMDVEVLIDQGLTIVHSDRSVSMTERHNNDPYAATRRAIVRAAASIGEQMK